MAKEKGAHLAQQPTLARYVAITDAVLDTGGAHCETRRSLFGTVDAGPPSDATEPLTARADSVCTIPSEQDRVSLPTMGQRPTAQFDALQTIARLPACNGP